MLLLHVFSVNVYLEVQHLNTSEQCDKDLVKHNLFKILHTVFQLGDKKKRPAKWPKQCKTLACIVAFSSIMEIYTRLTKMLRLS